MANSKNKTTGAPDFVNPFTPGVTYADFLLAIPEGVSIAEYCGENITKEELTWIELEISYYNNK